MINHSLLLTLKTNISPLSMVTVSKSPSQMSGAWLSGSLGGCGGAGGLGGGGGGKSFLTGGVTGSGSGWESVGLEEGMMGVEVGNAVGSGLAGGSRLSLVGLGESVGGLVGEEEVGSSVEGEGEGVETLPGSSSGMGGEVGASLMRGGPGKRKDGELGFRM